MVGVGVVLSFYWLWCWVYEDIVVGDLGGLVDIGVIFVGWVDGYVVGGWVYDDVFVLWVDDVYVVGCWGVVFVYWCWYGFYDFVIYLYG